MKKLLLSTLSVVAALGVNLQGAQPKKDSFNYADHELKGELADDIRKLQSPQGINQLPGFDDLGSDHWRVGEYKGAILKAPFSDKLTIVGTERADIVSKQYYDKQLAGKGVLTQKEIEDINRKYGLDKNIQKEAVRHIAAERDSANFRAMQARSDTYGTESQQWSIYHGATQNISRVRNAHRIQGVIKRKNASDFMGVADKKVVRLKPNEPFIDSNCVVVATKVQGREAKEFRLKEIPVLGDVVEETGLYDITPKNFLRDSQGKLMFIDTENLEDLVEGYFSKKTFGSYKLWKLHHEKCRAGRSKLLSILADMKAKKTVQSEEQGVWWKQKLSNQLSYYKHDALMHFERTTAITAAIVATGLGIRHVLYVYSDNKLLNKCIQAMHEKTEAIRKDLELLSEEERTDKIRDIVIDVLKENCPKDQDSATIDAFVSLVYADVFVINDQEKKATIKESTRVIKKAWGDEWSLWAKAKRLATKVISLGRTNKVTKADEESELTREEAVTAVA